MHVDLVDRAAVERAPDLIHRVRALSFFKRHLAHGIAEIARRHGLVARIDERLAPRVFVPWVESLVAQRAFASVDRRDYIVFGAANLLRRLVETRPIRVARSGDPTAFGSAEAWPEGGLAAAYCVSVLDAVFAQEGYEPVRLSPAADDPALWQSFRENAADEPHLAIPYFDLVIGNEPNWVQPTWARARPAQQQALAGLRGPRLLM